MIIIPQGLLNLAGGSIMQVVELAGYMYIVGVYCRVQKTAIVGHMLTCYSMEGNLIKLQQLEM